MDARQRHWMKECVWGIGYCSGSHQIVHSLENRTADIGQLPETPRMAKPQLIIIQSHEVENGRMNVSNGDGVVHRTQSELVGLSDRRSLANISTRHPHDQAIFIVIAT